MSLQIFNTLTRKKDIFTPIEENKVKMYVCGMTVYDYCHLGHARVLVSFDVIVRYLRSQGYDVTYVRNITDIDDKILNRANENGESFTSLTERFIEAMHEDEARLSVKKPDIEPKATSHIAEIISMIQQLIDNGFAYTASNGDVYYSVDKFPEYGALSKKNPEELLAGARIGVEDAKKDPRDFALWKSVKKDEVSWDSPWGAGRPGWHIECSAMSTCCLGDTFDIHGGGPDLPFPHHENEIAQSEGATGKKYVNYWMHAGAIRVNKEKMSKSLGNFFTIRDVLERYPAEVVRYFLVSSHYRSQVDYSEESLKEAQSALSRLYTALRDVESVEGGVSELALADEYKARFKKAMNDDFNTPVALAVMFDLVKELNRAKASGEATVGQLAQLLRELGEILGILQLDAEEFLKSSSGFSNDSINEAEIEQLIIDRVNARQNKDWAESDRIRDYLKDEGVILDDRKEGTVWRRG
ncbi:cysteine--tRNA ligase [Alkalimarinus alittae]|uniref:Cysteine--tRNA ligase n=1 Tax=Alkalimarinus alittae TaxID=2961619 RepID=A0ABY6MY15_9ALTE|nr:cysteine--tRNA ligase [Alkalimarinus alittae]UZE94672.1 cysteine--tRNA ligase [Alkalimarinus alittae]